MILGDRQEERLAGIIIEKALGVLLRAWPQARLAIDPAAIAWAGSSALRAPVEIPLILG